MMRRYAITDRRLFAGTPDEQKAALVARAAVWARAGVEWIQLREKDLDRAALEELAGEMVRAVRAAAGPTCITEARTRVLVNGDAAVALAAGAAGVHLPRSDEPIALRAQQVRVVYGAEAVVSVACHTAADAVAARAAGASLILFAPVFEKPLWTANKQGALAEALPGVGLRALAAACALAAEVPVYALGGVTQENAPACIAAGAAGVAGVRLFAGRQSLSEELY